MKKNEVDLHIPPRLQFPPDLGVIRDKKLRDASAEYNDLRDRLTACKQQHQQLRIAREDAVAKDLDIRADSLRAGEDPPAESHQAEAERLISELEQTFLVLRRACEKSAVDLQHLFSERGDSELKRADDRARDEREKLHAAVKAMSEAHSKLLGARSYAIWLKAALEPAIGLEKAIPRRQDLQVPRLGTYWSNVIEGLTESLAPAQPKPTIQHKTNAWPVDGSALTGTKEVR